MYVHRSNRLEALADTLAEIVSTPLGSPTRPEIIVVQSRSMERWVSMRLAQRYGVWANPSFPFPRSFVEQAIAAVLGEPSERSIAFSPERLVWAVARALVELLPRPEFEALRAYGEGDVTGAKRLELAAQIADTFDQYCVYRPDWVLAWEQGDADDWQAILWRKLVDLYGSVHLAAQVRSFQRAMSSLTRLPADLPPRISLFGLSTLPPIFLDVLTALSPLVDVHLFVLAPSRFGRTTSRSSALLSAGVQPSGLSEALDDSAHVGFAMHPLVDSFGRLGRHFELLLADRTKPSVHDVDLFREPGAGNILTALQSDMLTSRCRGIRGGDAQPLDFARDDQSISVHACHGPMREVEVLRDQLLAIFEQDTTLEPRDVVVMTPDLETYAPLIEAVFGVDRNEPGYLPFRILGHSARSEQPVIDAFLVLLDVLQGRLEASTVLDLLALDVVRSGFEIAEIALEKIRHWIGESFVRWGVDAEHRSEAGQPASGANTWQFGLDRLLLGYAMPGDDRTLFGGTLPLDDVEGGGAVLLGQLADFCQALFETRREIRQPRTLDEWSRTLSDTLARMIAATSETDYQHQKVREALASVAAHAADVGFRDTVDLGTVLRHLEAELVSACPSRGLLSGGITFCDMRSMRAVPLRVACLLGMNDGVFPRTNRTPSFDLTTRQPRAGDRSFHDEDRYLMLEAILSVRQRLIVTYTGQSIEDNSTIPPSVVIGDLMDALADTFRVPKQPQGDRCAEHEGDEIRQWLLVRHPLQPFNPRYFGSDSDPRLFSYSEAHAQGARASGGQRRAPPRFFDRPLEPLPRSTEVTLDDLVTFFEHPTRTLLQTRLGLRLHEHDDRVEDGDPMTVEGLAKYALGSKLIDAGLAGVSPADQYPYVVAAGALPHGMPGRCAFDDLTVEVERVVGATDACRKGERLLPVAIDVVIRGVRITGWVRDLWPGGMVRHRFGHIRGKDEIALWVRHLALACAARKGSLPSVSVLVGRADKGDGVAVYRYTVPADPEDLLAHLLEIRRTGLDTPLPLFPESSRACAQALRGEKPGVDDRERAMRAARDAFERGRWPERDEPEIRKVFGEEDPLDPNYHPLGDAAARPLPFAELAQAVYGPLLSHRRDEET